MNSAAKVDYKELYNEQIVIIEGLRAELEQLKKMIFGTRSERFIPTENNVAQLTLDLDVEIIENVEIETKEVTKTITTVTHKPIQHPGRSKLPAHLRREKIIIEPVNIPEGAKKIGEEITEELEYVQGEMYVNQYIRPKYVITTTEEITSKIAIAPMPMRPIEKAIAGSGLLAQIIIDKYVDHLPLYRQMQRFERCGVKVAYATLADWVSGSCKLIEPLYQALKKRVLSSGYLHADETTIRVLDKEKSGQCHRGYFWVYSIRN